jgi:hypothetical protein
MGRNSPLGSVHHLMRFRFHLRYKISKNLLTQQGKAMSDTIQITGTIKNARFFDIGSKQIVCGQIYGDAGNRFEDGTQINTSEVISVDGDLVTTRNSVYRIERRAA